MSDKILKLDQAQTLYQDLRGRIDALPTSGDIPEVPVQDVQVAGTSVVGNDGVANIPSASLGGDYGTVKLRTNTASSGLTLNSDGTLTIAQAQPQNYHVGTSSNPMSVYYMNYATFYGLARAAGITSSSNINATGSYNSVGQYTEEAKTAIKEMLGVQDGLKVVRLI